MKFIALCFLVACAGLPVYATDVPVSQAADSVYKITIVHDGVEIGSGTAWIAGVHDGHTYLVTAGHVCSAAAGDGAAEKHYILTGRDSGAPIAFDKLVGGEAGPDLCVVWTSGTFGKPMWLAADMPEYGAEVTYIGAPLGIYGDGVAPFYTGHYVGGNMVAMPAAGGASGGAIFTPAGVFGVLVSRARAFESATYFVPLDELKKFLASAGA